MFSRLFKVYSFILALFFTIQGRGAEPYEFSREVYQCQHPMALENFSAHIRQGQGHKAIRWDFRALSFDRPLSTRVIKMAQDTISPGGTLAIGEHEVAMKPLTLERKFLQALRGTEAVEHISRRVQVLLWINETYHLFSLQSEDLAAISNNDPIFATIENGAFVFTTQDVAFIVGKDQRYFVVCPKQGLHETPTELNKRQVMAEIIRFMQDPRVRRFFQCEALLS